MRKRKQRHVYELPIVISGSFDRDASLVVVKELIKFLLFSRGQTPTSCDQLVAALQEQQHAILESANELARRSRKRKVSSSFKRACKFVNLLAGMLAKLDSNSPCVALLLGPSPSRPRELYTITLDCDSDPLPAQETSLGETVSNLVQQLRLQDGHAADVAAPVTDVVSRPVLTIMPTNPPAKHRATILQALRTLVLANNDIPEWENLPVVTKAFVMAQSPIVQEGTQAPAGFQPRHGLVLDRACRALQVHISVRRSHAGVKHGGPSQTSEPVTGAVPLPTPAQGAQQAGGGLAPRDGHVWCQMVGSLHGLRPAKAAH